MSAMSKRASVAGWGFLLSLLLLGAPAGAKSNKVADLRPYHFADEIPQAVKNRVIADLKANVAASKCNTLTVEDRVNGSFTRPGAKETLYLLSNCPEATGLVYRDGKFFNRVSLPRDGSNLGNIRDINGDGIDDLLVVQAVPRKENDAFFDDELTFLTLAGGVTHIFADFPKAGVNECSTDGYGTMNALVISVTTAAAPVFNVQQMRSTNNTCDRPAATWKTLKTWKVVGKRKQ